MLFSWAERRVHAETQSAGEAFTFGFVTLADSDVWCKSVCREFENYVASTYPECKVVTADGNCDANLQIQAVENFIAQQIDALVIQPVDADATGPAIEAANQAGIPVITTAIRANAGDYTYVGPENPEAANKTGIMVLGLNANDAALEAIKEGTMTASLKQDAVAIADTAADLAVNAAKGEDIEDTYIPWIMITKNNVDTE